jgi:serine/threonine protein kinase
VGDAIDVIAKFGSFEYALADHFQFERELGHGAMGTVYLAHDTRLERPVAIKVLHRVLTNELGIARFQSEVRIAAALHHPGIVGIHEYDEVDDRLFYVMDYLAGESLRARIKRDRQLSIDDALAITTQVADGLQYAHDNGVVHRDVKPENIVLSEGRAWLVDFGLALAISRIDAKRLTATGITVGTPQYLSPEQAAAEKSIGPAADQYALACVLYEMLVGEPPFNGPTATAIAARHIIEVPSLLRERRRDTPVEVEAAVARALRKNPVDRFASISEFAEALRPREAPKTPRAVDVRVLRTWSRTTLVAGITALIITAAALMYSCSR